MLAAAAVGALALGLGVPFLTSTREALERAEAFRLRRMTVNRLGDEGAYRFFFVSNRAAEAGDGPLASRLGRERGEGLTFGRFDTDIEPSLGIGMLIDPSDWFQNEEIRLLDVRERTQGEFLAELRDQVRRSPYRAVIVKINGFRERFPSALRKTAFVGHVLDIDAPLLVFDWPADQGSSPRGYRRAQRLARESGAELARVLSLLIDRLGAERLWILANSMGGEVAVDALVRLAQEPELADAETEIEDLVLTAPDVDREEFGAAFREVIDPLVRHLTIYVSSNDRALLMSRVLNRGARLGESTVDPGNPDMAVETARAFELVEPGRDRVGLVDVTAVNRTRNFHNFSLETPEFFDDLFLQLVNRETPRNRLRYRVRAPGGRHYWLLTRGR